MREQVKKHLLTIDLEQVIKDKIVAYKKQIRQPQVDAIKNIIESYVLEGFDNVILDAPTGYGKSIMGIISYDILDELHQEAEVQNYADKGYIFIHNNSLVDQYDRDYSEEIPSFLVVKGASNYDCLHVTDGDASMCAMPNIRKSGNMKAINRCKEECEYLINRAKIPYSNLVVTNNQFMITKSMYTDGMEQRLFAIYDEAHLFNDSFVSHVGFEYTSYMLRSIIKSAEFYNIGKKNKDSVEGLKRDIVKITEANYEKYLEKFIKTMNKLCVEYEGIKKDYENEMRNDTDISKISKLIKRYEGYLSNLALYDDSFEFVVSVDKADTEDGVEVCLKLQPIFVGELYKDMSCATYNLFMSGSIDKYTFEQEVSVDNCKFIKLEPVFPPSSKVINFFNYEKLNFSVMNDKEAMLDILDQIAFIVNTEAGKNGMIHTNSFYVSNLIKNHLQTTCTHKLFCQEKGEKLPKYVKDFKAFKKPSILITPSGYEGIDLPDDECRFMIIIKAPYPSLADARQKYIMTNYPKLYRAYTLKKILQAIGRGTRSVDDYCITYTIDTNIHTLFKAKDNLWKNEFQIVEHD